MGATMNKSRKLRAIGILNVISGVGLALAGLGGCMNVINAGRTQDAWIIALLVPGTVAMISGLRVLDGKAGWHFAIVGSVCAIPAVAGLVSTAMVATCRAEFGLKPEISK